MVFSSFIVTDNSGVEKILILTNLTRKKKSVKLGDLIVGVIKKVNKHSTFNISSIVHGVIIRTKTDICNRKCVLKFNDNSLVLVDKNLNPLASRILGPLPLILKNKGCLKLNSLTIDFI